MTSILRAPRTHVLLAASLAAFSFLSVIGIARAEQSVSLSPVIIEKGMKPGDTYKDVIRVTNFGGEPVNVVSSVADFYYDANGTMQFVEADKTPLSTASIKAWMKIADASFTLQPKETKEVSYTVSVPTNAEPGGHYGVLFFSTVPPGQTGGSTLKIQGRVGTLVLVEVPGDVRKTAEISNFRTGVKKDVDNKTILDPTSTYEQAPVDFGFSLKNTGNAHFTPEGTITIENMFGRRVAEISAQPEGIGARLRAFPNVSREFLRTWDAGFLLGSYTATLNVTDGTGKHLAPQTVRFTVLPWKFILAAVLIALVVISLLVALIKRYNVWIVSQAKHKK